MLAWVKQFAASFELAIAGLIGAFVAARWHRDELPTRGDYALFLLTGLLCAHFLTDLVAAHFGITQARSVAGVGFLIGAFGGSIIAAIVRAVKNADLWSIAKSKFGSREQ